MEKGIDQYIREQFQMGEVDIRMYSPLTLAFIGDGVFDVVIRTVVVAKGNTRAAELHRRTSRIVNAHTQALMIEAVKEDLTEKERDVYRWGKNAKSHTIAKHATVADYRKATGFEALIGYLYLTDSFERIVELTKLAVERLSLVF